MARATSRIDVHDDVYDAIAHARNVILAEGFTQKQYDDLAVPQMDRIVKMQMARLGPTLGVSIEIEYVVDWKVVDALIDENKPLDERTVKAVIASLEDLQMAWKNCDDRGADKGIRVALQRANSLLDRVQSA